MIDVKELREAAENHKKYGIEIPADSYIALLDRLEAAERRYEVSDASRSSTLNRNSSLEQEVVDLRVRLAAAERELAKAEKVANHWVQVAIGHKERAEALAAYAELFKAKAAELKEQYPLSPWINQHYDYLVKSAPDTTSLARRDAEKQAGVLEKQRDRWDSKALECRPGSTKRIIYTSVGTALDLEAKELRRQAEDPTA